MKHSKAFFIISMIIFAAGDFFYFGSLIFRKFMVDFLIFLAPSYSISELSETGKMAILFTTCIIGAMMYLIGFLLWGMTKESREEQRKYYLYGLSFWFVTDSISSAIFKFYFNIFVNVVFLGLGYLFYHLSKNENDLIEK